MALSSSTVWEVRTTGSDTNGGGFVTGASGTDWSQQNSPQYSVTDAVTAGTTTITSATANFGTDVVGNILYISGGTGSITGDWYQITSRTNSTTIVVDRSTGLTTGTGATLKIGGAFATPGRLNSPMVTGNKAWIKTGTYTLTTSTAGPGGPVSVSGKNGLEFEGYSATRGDLGTPPTISAGAIANITIFDFGGSSGSSRCAINIKVDGNSQSTITGFNNAQNLCIKCIAANCTTAGFNNVLCLSCFASGCGVGFGGIPAAHYCYAKNCTTGYNLNTSTFLFGCIAYGGTTSFNLAGVNFQGNACVNCVAYDPTGVGFLDGSGSRTLYLANCIAVSCTYGLQTLSRTTYRKFAYYNCSLAGVNVSSGQTMGDSAIALSADPFTNASGDDFSLNSVAGGGALLKALGIDATLFQTQTANYLDLGAAQVQASSGGYARRPR